MTREQFLTFVNNQKSVHLTPTGGFKFKVSECDTSIRKFGARETKKRMIGNIYDWVSNSSVDGMTGRIYLNCPGVSFNPSFYYTDLELVEHAYNKLPIPIEPQKLDYKHDEYAKILDK
jgi:hypothetical protein